MDENVKKLCTLSIQPLPNIGPLLQIDKSAQLSYFRSEFAPELIHFFEKCRNLIASFSKKFGELWIHTRPYLKVCERVQEI